MNDARGLTDAGSYRDPAGHVYYLDGRVLRTVAERAASDYEYIRDRGLLTRWVNAGWLVESNEIDPSVLGTANGKPRYVLEHAKIPFVSYPYEWPFSALKAAALLHLDLQLAAFDESVVFSDASAYNVQFVGPRPVFIDVLSFRRYQAGEFWTGHRQFCEQFLNPLLLRSLFGVPHNAWYRGNLEGISTEDLCCVVPLSRRLSWKIFAHVILLGRLQKSAIKKQRVEDMAKLRQRKFPPAAYRGVLSQLRKWIAGIGPRGMTLTIWADYDRTHTYATEEETAKRNFVGDFVAQAKPKTVWDLGCNTGEYSEVALKAGAERVIGFDFDQGALEKAFSRAEAKRLNLLPLFLDAANPTPDQGWNSNERKSLTARQNADAVLALAFEHHLAIGRNVPLNHVVSWIVSLARRGIIEFVPKSDATVQKMLALRSDIFDDYTEESFKCALASQARILKVQTVSATGRRLYAFERD